MPVKDYGTGSQALLDTGSDTNLISSNLETDISLTPEGTDRNVIVADGNTFTTRGVISGVTLAFF